jgi:hypothetical protein
MVRNKFSVALILVGILLGFVPVSAFADAPTGKEPWYDAFLEANPEGFSGYVIKNLVNSQWQDGLNIWWRATVPCGTFTGGGLSATWNRAGCGTIDYAKIPVSIAIFIENTKVSGNEYAYADGYTVKVKYPREHLIVFAEYPEEGYKHGFGTGLKYAEEDALLKYSSAQEGTTNTKPFPFKPEADESAPSKRVPEVTPASVQITPEQSGGGGVPWVPIVIVVAAVGGAAYWIRSRLIGGDYGGGIKKEELKPIPENPEKKKERIKNACNAEYLVMEKAQHALEGASMRRFNAHDRAVQSEGATEGKWGPQYGKEYADRLYAENGGGHHEGLRSQNAYEEAEEAYEKAKAAYDLCVKTEAARDPLGYAPADYVKPDDVPDEPEVM